MNRITTLEESKKIELANKYKDMLSRLMIDDEPIKSKTICQVLKITDREWRKKVEDMQFLYMSDCLPKLIIGTNKGYVYTNNIEKIISFLEHKEHQFKSMAYNTYHLIKVISKKPNLRFEEFLINTSTT